MVQSVSVVLPVAAVDSGLHSKISDRASHVPKVRVTPPPTRCGLQARQVPVQDLGPAANDDGRDWYVMDPSQALLEVDKLKSSDTGIRCGNHQPVNEGLEDRFQPSVEDSWHEKQIGFSSRQVLPEDDGHELEGGIQSPIKS
jgi:hypothetical protein